ncbi:MAG: S8 family serine peptidase [Gemmatimonadales bacterium]
MGVAAVAAGCAESGEPVGPGSGPQLQVGSGQQRGYIVVFQDGTVNASALTTSLARQVGAQARFTYERAIPGFAADLSDAQLQAVRRDPRVKYVEADQLVHTTATQSPTPSWGLDRIDQTNLPLNNSYTYTSNGAGVRLYGIDTGIFYGHPDFGGRASKGFDAITPGGNANDCHGHGTHTASTAAGTTYGVAKGMTIIGVRVLDCTGSGTNAQVIAGIDWVTINRILPAVANMSLGGGFSSALNTAVKNSVAAGVVYSVSAGNSSFNACLQSPASEPDAITVGSTTITDARSSFSNFGTCLDIWAPGSNITAAVWPSGTAVFSGTSMAAPHVAGVAGQYLQQNPTATPAAVVAALVANASSGKVTGIPANPPSPNKLLNMSFLNAPPPPGSPPVAAVVVTCGATSCTFNGSGSTDDLGIVAYEWRPCPTCAILNTNAIWSMNLSPNTRTWSLTVRDAGGLQDVESFTFTVPGGPPPPNNPPVANVAVTCVAGGTCTFNGSGSSDSDGTVVAYDWKPGSPTTISTQQVWSMKLSPRTRTWTLTVTDDDGATNTKSFTFTPLP